MVSLRLAAAVLPGITLIGCDENREEATQQQSISYATREPGSTTTPTNETSFALISAGGLQRLARLQSMIIEEGNQCNFVTNGIFKNGFDGTDKWLVTCADSGNWTIWFQPGQRPEVLKCSTSECL